MQKYPSIKTVWTRDPDNKYKTLVEGQWAIPEFEYLRSNNWIWTEKVDGTNIRVIYEAGEGGHIVRFNGRTDRAQIPAFLFARLQDLFTSFKLSTVFETPASVCLYGEGYGAKIQKGGGSYIPDGVDFILFDVKIGGEYFLDRENVEDIAARLGIDIVPIVGEGTLLEAIQAVQTKPHSWINSNHELEGLVMRPEIELLGRRGQRIITKVKARDFA